MVFITAFRPTISLTANQLIAIAIDFMSMSQIGEYFAS